MFEVQLRESNKKIQNYQGKFSQTINGNEISIDVHPKDSGRNIPVSVPLSIYRIFKPDTILDLDGIYEFIKASKSYEHSNYFVFGEKNEIKNVDMISLFPFTPRNVKDISSWTKELKRKIEYGWNYLNSGGFFVLYLNDLPNLYYTDRILSLLENQEGSVYQGMLKYEYRENVNPIWIFRKLDSFNPKAIFDTPCRIIPEKYQGKTFHVIREDKLISGMKQRVTFKYLEKRQESEIFYRGPVNGYTQVCLAYTCNLLGKKCHLILNKQKEKYKITCLAMIFGAIVHEIEKTKDEKEQVNNIMKDYENPFLVPLGMVDEETIKYYQETELKQLISIKPKNIWLVCSTGILFKALHSMLSECEFSIMFMTKENEEIKKMKRVKQTFVCSIPFRSKAKILPPYPTEASYDAKVWEYVLKFGEDGDFVLNVAGI